MPDNSFKPKANSVVAGAIAYSISDLIDHSFEEIYVSPIDNFIDNTREINRLFRDDSPSQVLGNLVILGYVSAIESYFRTLFRKIILIDDIAKQSCEKKQVNYGAALVGDSNMLPEALFEGMSLAGRRNILLLLKDFIGLSLQDSSLPPDLSDNFDKFTEICELRHCIVHRFGKFGSSNAIALGLSEHFSHVEKPIKCSFNTLQEIMTICQNTVRIMNNFLFEKIMNRLIVDGKRKLPNTIWTWNYSDDNKLFKKYYNIFYCTLSPPSEVLTVRKFYNAYKNHYMSIR